MEALRNARIKGDIVYFGDDARGGIHYLLDDLDYNEARVFFTQARSRGEVRFEDDDARLFVLQYSDGKYVLVRR
jgi:hypothetical protein